MINKNKNGVINSVVLFLIVIIILLVLIISMIVGMYVKISNNPGKSAGNEEHVKVVQSKTGIIECGIDEGCFTNALLNKSKASFDIDEPNYGATIKITDIKHNIFYINAVVVKKETNKILMIDCMFPYSLLSINPQIVKSEIESILIFDYNITAHCKTI